MFRFVSTKLVLLASAFFVAISGASTSSGQGGLYTEGPGVNPPFEDISHLITSTSGYPGTVIDVNNSAVEGGFFGSLGIENDLRLHTLANSSVPEGSHGNWSRWYQTDGATQVFRLFTGEENLQNNGSPPLRARIEAFDANTAWNVDDGEWHEWVGRYTIVDPIGAAIFQVKDLDDDWAMQLNLDNTGRVRVQHRRPMTGQPKFETLVQNAIGQPFDVRIRDNGLDYEVYYGNQTQPFTTGQYVRNTEPGDDNDTRFRWGMYKGANPVLNDGMIFVSHASVDPNISFPSVTVNDLSSNIELGSQVDPPGHDEIDGIAGGSTTLAAFNALSPTVIQNWSGPNAKVQGINLDDVDLRVTLDSPLSTDAIEILTTGTNSSFSSSQESEPRGHIRWNGRQGQTLTIEFGTWDVSASPIFTPDRNVDAAGLVLLNFGVAYDTTGGQTVTYYDSSDNVLDTQTFFGGADTSGNPGTGGDWFTGYDSPTQNIAKITIDITRDMGSSTLGFDDIAFVVDSSIPGDFNGDGLVNGLDLLEWQWNPSVGNLSDWEANYGQNLAANASTIPEPSALAIVLMGISVLVSRRKSRS